jgi:hypothetical protein
MNLTVVITGVSLESEDRNVDRLTCHECETHVLKTENSSVSGYETALRSCEHGNKPANFSKGTIYRIITYCCRKLLIHVSSSTRLIQTEETRQAM